MSGTGDPRKRGRARRMAARTLVDGRWVAPIGDEVHGTSRGYNYEHCRCDRCRAAILVLRRRAYKPPRVDRAARRCTSCKSPFTPSRFGVVPDRCEYCRHVAKLQQSKTRHYEVRGTVPLPAHNGCLDCGISIFNPPGTGERRKLCQGCRLARKRARAPEVARRSNLKRKYGLSVDEYEAMHASQGGVCAICGQATEQRLSVDHCHGAGTVRALLCAPCNYAIGFMKDDPLRLVKGALYVVQHGDAEGRELVKAKLSDLIASGVLELPAADQDRQAS